MRFCQKHGLHLISDEIYALSVWDNPDAPDAPGFTSVLSIKNDGLIDPSLVHVLWGMSKVRILPLAPHDRSTYLFMLVGLWIKRRPSRLRNQPEQRAVASCHRDEFILRMPVRADGSGNLTDPRR